MFAGYGKTSDEQIFVQVWPGYPPRKRIENGYQKLVDRGVRCNIFFIGTRIDNYNYEEYLYDMDSNVKFGDLVKLQYMPDTVHIFTEEKGQHAITNGITEWLESLPPHL